MSDYPRTYWHACGTDSDWECDHRHSTWNAAFRCARKSLGLKAKDPVRCVAIEEDDDHEDEDIEVVTVFPLEFDPEARGLLVGYPADHPIWDKYRRALTDHDDDHEPGAGEDGEGNRDWKLDR